MHKRIVAFLCALPLALSGCAETRQIESAAIIENVSVDRRDGRLVYTFYRLTSDDKPWGISVCAQSFEEACRSASAAYIPNLSLAKLELLLISEDASEAVIQTDLPYISTQPFFSPVAYVTLCDDGTMEAFEKTNRAQRLIEQRKDIRFLHELTCVHHIHVVADLRDHSQIVADEENAGP